MRSQVYLTAVAVVVVVSAWLAYKSVGPSEDTERGLNVGEVWEYEGVEVEDGVGPESFAFNPDGEGPYTGISDGRIIKWDRHEKRWVNFAVTSPHRGGCGGPSYDHHKSEHTCGRPLGLCFSRTGDLYIADAYMGLLVVGPNGGTATRIAHRVETTPLAFTNSLDIHHQTGLVYFTSSSSIFQRRNYVSLILSRDNTGMLMKYDPEKEQVSVVLRNLSFANGVALSKDGEYILVVETINCRVLRYWLGTPKAGSLEVFAEVPGFPDNIKRSPRGGYWVGIYSRQEKLSRWILSYPWIGKALLKLPLDIPTAYSYLAKLKGTRGMAIRLSEEGEALEMIEERSGKRGRSISEVEERDGTLWVGSIDAPFAAKYNILDAK